MGEIMLRLTPPNYEKIRMTHSFEASYGGAVPRGSNRHIYICSYIDIMAYKPGITLNDETRGQYQYCLRVFFI